MTIFDISFKHQQTDRQRDLTVIAMSSEPKNYNNTFTIMKSSSFSKDIHLITSWQVVDKIHQNHQKMSISQIT